MRAVKIVFKCYLTTDNLLEQVKEFVAILNQLGKEKRVGELIHLDGTKISFNNGGMLEGSMKGSSMRFVNVDLGKLLSQPKEVEFYVLNLARYALLSHRLFNQIKTGLQGAAIMIGTA